MGFDHGPLPRPRIPGRPAPPKPIPPRSQEYIKGAWPADAQRTDPLGIVYSQLRDPGASDVAGEPIDWRQVARGWKAAYFGAVDRYNGAAAAHNELLAELLKAGRTSPAEIAIVALTGVACFLLGAWLF